MFELWNGDSAELLKDIPTDSVDAVVCDPPYGMKFMGKKWDYQLPSVDIWWECLRVLKPGGFLLAFSGARTYHRLVVGIEDAGFVVHPMVGMLGWINGQGFPKGTDVGKAVDKRAGVVREVIGENPNKRREDVELRSAGRSQSGRTTHPPLTAPATEEVKKWDGYKYGLQALKPALEPICVAQKPYEGKPLDSILEHDVGAFDIDGCRIGVDASDDIYRKNPHTKGRFGYAGASIYMRGGDKVAESYDPSKGRYPANLVMVHGPGCIQDGVKKVKETGGSGTESPNAKAGAMFLDGVARFFTQFHADEPPFLYCPKASSSERNAGVGGKNPHPTVKPIKLMRWLIRLVTRPGALVLDPFCGSGSTGCAAVLEGRDFIGIDLDVESVAVARQRIEHWKGVSDDQKEEANEGRQGRSGTEKG